MKGPTVYRQLHQGGNIVSEEAWITAGEKVLQIQAQLTAAEARAEEWKALAEQGRVYEEQAIAAEARAERYREAAQAYVDSVVNPAPIDTARSLAWGNLLAALADVQTRGEHLAEQRASEDWQESKWAKRERGNG